MISNNQKTYLFLSALELSYKKYDNIIAHYAEASEFLNAIKIGDEFLIKQFGKKYNEYKERFDNFSFKQLENYFTKHEINFITIEDNEYPECLRQLDQPPHIIYYRGDISLINTQCIAVVGTRSPTYYGRENTEVFVKALCAQGFTIVSGLAVGIDRAAHQGALDNNGKTIAVLGNGFANVYPSVNINLSEEIVNSGGLLVTEYYPSFKACTYSFPARNRIIAALSKAVLIPEATMKSGSLYTKDFALDLGKDVFCIPGNITSEKSDAPNFLIKHGHAACVTCAQDIFDYYGIDVKAKEREPIFLDFDEVGIVSALQDGERSFDDIQIITRLSPQKLNSCLTTLQIRGIIKKLPGNFYIRSVGG